MTYETKNVTFHMIHVKVSIDSWCSRTLPMNVARVHIVVVREIRARIGRRDVESMVEYDQRQIIISNSDTQILELV